MQRAALSIEPKKHLLMNSTWNCNQNFITFHNAVQNTFLTNLSRYCPHSRTTCAHAHAYNTFDFVTQTRCTTIMENGIACFTYDLCVKDKSPRLE